MTFCGPGDVLLGELEQRDSVVIGPEVFGNAKESSTIILPTRLDCRYGPPLCLGRVFRARRPLAGRPTA